MILVDANLLVYASLRESPDHEAARDWLQARLGEPDRVGLPWHSLLAFLRLVTNPRVCRLPLAITTAWEQVEDWLERPNAWIPQPTDRHAEVMRGVLQGTRVGGNLVSDAHLAALSLEHGLTVCSRDSDFARFPGVRWLDPLRPG